MSEKLARDGFAMEPHAIPPALVDELLRSLSLAPHEEAVRVRGAGAYAMRSVFRLVPAARALADAPEIRALVEPTLGLSAKPVKATLFDKTPDANWTVGWHQDVTIAVRERREVEGFGSWSVKAGVAHVQPPASVLEGMLAVRIHLDPCAADNGALRVIPGSHAHGRLPLDHVQDWIARGEAVTCALPAGGALLMRPLLLHASSPAARPGHRRVLHIEFASEALPGGLEWSD